MNDGNSGVSTTEFGSSEGGEGSIEVPPSSQPPPLPAAPTLMPSQDDRAGAALPPPRSPPPAVPAASGIDPGWVLFWVLITVLLLVPVAAAIPVWLHARL